MHATMNEAADKLVIVKARQHNLADVSCELPRHRLVVITGPSGSGKSSLAFDTIYAEGQRRYVESLSVYARQFLRQLPKPDVESIDGLSPAIAIEQKSLGRSPRSTVGTVTEMADYLRLLFARVGQAHCPVTGRPLYAHSVQEIVDTILARPESRVVLLAPITRGTRDDLSKQLDQLRKDGFVRVRIDGEVFDLNDSLSVDATQPHDLDVVVDRIVARASAKQRITDSVELALSLGSGSVLLDFSDGQPPTVLSDRLVSWETGMVWPPLEPRLFSFNHPQGACPVCDGLGMTKQLDPELVITNPERSLRQGAIAALGRRGSLGRALLVDRLVKEFGVDADAPWDQLPEKQRRALLDGGPATKSKSKSKKARFEGILALVQRTASRDENDPSSGDGDDEEGSLTTAEAQLYFTDRLCTACGGQRLRPEALAVRVAGSTIGEVMDLDLVKLDDWLEHVSADSNLGPQRQAIAKPLLKALSERTKFLREVGLSTLTLSRPASTLSGGEGQRIRLATQIGAALVGVLYVLDEPSVGLHPKDNDQLLQALRRLVDKGNSVLVVEHDRDAILAADYVVDMGPGAGTHGGHIVAQGTVQQLLQDPNSVTARYLEGRAARIQHERVARSERSLIVRHAELHNLRGVDAEFPVGLLVAVTGVSGSGKSSLVMDILLPEARKRLGGTRPRSSACADIEGLSHFDNVVSIDQTPIGRTPRSNPASYTGIAAQLRELYAALPEARARGYKPGRFSFNVKGGRCEKCLGDGLLRVQLHFLPDMYVTCDACDGKRYNRETLELKYRGLSIADALDCTVEEASDLFSSIPRIAQRLEGLRHIGLGYVRLGQSATTLSGGEAQRLKLASELWKRGSGRTLYILDEPTTGLHFSDVELLLVGLTELRDAGNTVVFIEHNMDLVANADWVIDLGPDGGEDGGRVVCAGPPETVAKSRASRTARYLERALEG